ncbi:Uncharacterized protein involved in exopolysaccharide biosynthesis [Alteromonadaceae bacterium Bs31]|nr:Uncharacterized protein involved in exopolysaccharide biosynthesis [Alteromonadaceae bacterium Bs31]
MNTLPAPITNSDRIRGTLRRMRGFRYFWTALIAVLLLVAIVILYLSRPPVYSSTMSVVLPGSGNSSNFNIEDVGTANQATNTPFSSVSFNPLVNYREIFKSREVMRSVSDRLGVSTEALRLPRVELRERTSILFIHVDGPSVDFAEAYAYALYDAFQESLERLRHDEMFLRDDSIRAALDQYRSRLALTRSAIVNFQQRALLVSTDQVKELMNTISTLNEKKITAQSFSRNTEDFVRQLSLDLGVSPALAGQAFRLQSDPVFRGYLKEMDASAMKVAEYSSVWGAKHPKVVVQKLRFEGVKKSLHFRSTEVVGPSAADILYAMDLSSNLHRAELFSSLMDNYAKLQGIEAEIKALEISEAKLQDRLKIYTRESAELERLEREHALAEAVFTSAAAKLEASKSDIFASYPAVQLLSTPSLPNAPKSPNTLFAIGLGVLGALFVLFGLLTAWHRQHLISLLLKNS